MQRLLNLSNTADIHCVKEVSLMIEVTRLNGNPMILNSDLIKTAESSPDTMLTLINGEKLLVRESSQQILEKVLAYRSQLLAAVARKLPSIADLHRVAALASLDLSSVNISEALGSTPNDQVPLPFNLPLIKH
jgi:flagellar protein FlbD